MIETEGTINRHHQIPTKSPFPALFLFFPLFWSHFCHMNLKQQLWRFLISSDFLHLIFLSLCGFALFSLRCPSHYPFFHSFTSWNDFTICCSAWVAHMWAVVLWQSFHSLLVNPTDHHPWIKQKKNYHCVHFFLLLSSTMHQTMEIFCVSFSSSKATGNKWYMYNLSVVN